MKRQTLGLLLACTLAQPAPLSFAGQVETDFNDLFLGNTMTRGNTASPNNGNVNTGSGFLPNVPTDGSGGRGEMNGNTGVVLLEKGDLILPTGASPGYLSEQKSPVDPLARGTNSGVVFGSSTNTAGEIFTRMQDRMFATPMTNNVIWFSFLFRADGPKAQGQLVLNPSDNSDNPADIGISIGSPTTPGAIAINTTPTQTPATLLAAANPNLLYYDGVGTADHNGNGVVDGVSVGKDSISAIRSHLIIGRITQNTAPGGVDTIDVWLDPTNGADPTGETPTLTYTGDELPTTGLAGIAFKGTRTFAPTPVGGPYTDGGHFSMDHVRLSDQANALAFVTGNVPVDPKLVIDAGSPGNFNFRGVYGTGNPLVSDPITVTLRNTGTTNPIDITGIDLTTASPVFTLVNPPALPITLAPGATTSITMQASSSTFETTYTNSLKILTSVPDQNKTLTVGATFYSAGSRINANSSLDSTINGWVSDNFAGDETPPAIVMPGFLGTQGKVLMKGAKTIPSGQPDNLSQTLLNGAKDWELAFFFSPLTEAQFLSDTGAAPTGTDRLFQVIIQSDNLVPVPAFSTFGKWTDLHNGVAGMINLAYLPAQGGFGVFNGSNWQSAGLPLLSGSTTANDVYLVRVKGTGFGTSAAKYTVSVSQPNSTLTAATSGNLSIWSSTSGLTNTPAAYTFTTGDVSTSGGPTVKSASFWLDEVSFFAVAARDPDCTVSGQSVTSHEGTTSAGGITVTNTGFSNNLVIDSATFQHSHIFSSPQVFPLTIAAGTTAHIPVNMINGFTSGNNAARGNVALATNVTLAPTANVSLLGSYTYAANLAGNWNFEILGGDTAGDTDSFAVWEETPNAVASKDVPGLVAGSTIAAYLGRNTGIATPFGVPVGDFVLEYDFAFKDAGDTDRSFFVQVGGTGTFTAPLFYQAGNWYVVEGEGSTEILNGVFLNPSADANGNGNLNDVGDVKNVYKMRFTGTGWKTNAPKYQFDLIDSTNQIIASSALLEYVFNPANIGANAIQFKTADVATAGLWVDNVRAGVIVESAVTITGFSKTSGGFTISWANNGNPIILERSTTLQLGSWETLPLGSVNFSGGTFTDTTPPADRAFYRIRKP